MHEQTVSESKTNAHGLHKYEDPTVEQFWESTWNFVGETELFSHVHLML